MARTPKATAPDLSRLQRLTVDSIDRLRCPEGLQRAVVVSIHCGHIAAGRQPARDPPVERTVHGIHGKCTGALSRQSRTAETTGQLSRQLTPRRGADELLQFLRKGTSPQFPPNACGQQAVEQAGFIPLDAGPELPEQPGAGQSESGLADILITGGMGKKYHVEGASDGSAAILPDTALPNHAS